MNRLKNKVILIGRLGADPETRAFEKGGKKTTFNVATNSVYKDKEGEKKTDTTWHRVSAWNGLGEVAENNLKTGSEVALEGRLTYFSYKDKEGQERYGTEIVADDIVLLGSAPK